MEEVPAMLSALIFELFLQFDKLAFALSVAEADHIKNDWNT